MKIEFIGAAHEVTGSSTLLEIGGLHYLVDYGMEQGINVFENVPLPVAPGDIEAVFLTHAHIDHSGMLPKLCKDGFKGTIYATSATCDLADIMLRDAAHIQMMDAEWKTRKAQRAGDAAVAPIYDLNDAQAAISLLRPCQYGKRYRVAEGVELRFTDMGHLLGSACVELWLTEGETTKKLVCSGDVGNTNQPIIKDPQTVEETDYLVLESTYGDRLHEQSGDAVSELAACIQRAFDRGGSVIIPSFAVGRTQELLYAIREIKQAGMVKGHNGFPVYVDSPLAAEATAVFLQCDESCLDEEALALVRQGINPLWFDGIRLTVSAEESKAINEDRSSKVILSSSGMCEAGRIRHHLKHNLWRKENIILFAGYQATGSLGRYLLDGAKNVRLFGEDVSVEAEICALHGTSGHADQKGLLKWLQGFRKKPQMVFLNHGEDACCEHFAELLRNAYGYQVETPFSGCSYDLATGRMLAFTEGKRVEQPKKARSQQRAKSAYETLVAAATELLEVAKRRKGMNNKDLGRFAAQIRSLLEKWG